MYLAHHGRKGQKWGVRNGPPYPLNQDSIAYRRTQALNYKNKQFNGKPTIVKQGSTVWRGVESVDDGFMDRKYTYTSVSDDYYNHSMATSEGFDGRFKYDYEMKTIKDLKIATLRDYYNAVVDSCGIDLNSYVGSMDSKTKDLGYSFVSKLPSSIVEGEGGNNPIFNKAIDHLMKKGFDGVYDPVDSPTQYKDEETDMITATVIFNPRQNLKVVNVKPR